MQELRVMTTAYIIITIIRIWRTLFNQPYLHRSVIYRSTVLLHPPHSKQQRFTYYSIATPAARPAITPRAPLATAVGIAAPPVDTLLVAEALVDSAPSAVPVEEDDSAFEPLVALV